MASLYPKDRSPFWWVQFVDKAGTRVNRSTGLRRDDAKQTVEARALRATLEAAELNRDADAIAKRQTGGWDFVPKYLKDDTHNKSPKTYERYAQAWHWISLFLAEHKIRHPREVRFAHGQQFVDWRKNYVKKSTGHSVSHNTAVLDLKVFARIMHRAVVFELCVASPLVKMGITRELPAETPEITKAEFMVIRPALEKQPEWMRLSFLHSEETGCRLRDTAFALADLDFDRNIIHFPNPKGGKKKAFSVPMPKTIKDVVQPLFRDGRKVAFTMPAQPSLAWRDFFDSMELKHLHFHSLRVTFVTELARRGVPRAAAMRLVNHGSELVHRLYQRLNVDDLRQYVATDDPSFPATSASGGGGATG